MKPHEMGIAEAARAIREKRLSAVELAEDCLAHIARREVLIGAWTHIDGEAMLAQAKACDARPPLGALHGVPIAIKDIIDTADMPTGYGSPIYDGHRPRMDAACVSLLKRAGAVIAGKTVTTEFAFFRPGKTRNPCNPAHTPGGSSSGSAAAVADAMVPGALGSQTAGSLIRPASYCGVVGYKPTYGDFDLTGVKGLSHSLDTLGVLTRSVADAELLRGALLNRPFSASDLPARWCPSIGLCRTSSWLDAAPHTRDGIERLLMTLAAQGARVGEALLPESFASFISLQKTVMAFEVSHSLAGEYDCYRNDLSAEIRALIEYGDDIDAESYFEARCAAEQGVRDVESIFDQWDVLLAPSATGEAPAGIEATGDPLFSRMWMLIGVPTLSLPALEGPNGLPIGVQLIGARFCDERLLRASSWIERAVASEPGLSSWG